MPAKQDMTVGLATSGARPRQPDLGASILRIQADFSGMMYTRPAMTPADDRIDANPPRVIGARGRDVFRRAVQVGRTVCKHLLVPWVLRRRTSTRAERMQAALEELGGTWVKLGQALALRFDVLPADYCLQFFQLLNQVRPFPSSEVRQILEEEFGRPVDGLFRSFDWEPLAAASIGQVHRAELPDGTVVAVKIQRPGIHDVVRADLRLMRGLATVVDVVLFAGRRWARDLVREFARWTQEELDYRVEARHATALRANAADDPLEYNARVYPDYTTLRVLTLEYLAGVPVIDIITAIRHKESAALDDLAARGHDVRRIASHITWNGLNQIYRLGYFHADPHPANLIVLPGDVIGYVDFGIVGRLDDRLTDSLRSFAQSLFAGHVEDAVAEFSRFLTPSRRTDIAAAQRDLVEALQDYLDGTRGLTTGEDLFEMKMLEIVRTHRMTLAPEAARYLKAVLTTDAMVKQLDPEFNLYAHENRFFTRLTRMEFTEALVPGGGEHWLRQARFQLDRLLESRAATGEQRHEDGAAARDMHRRVQRLSFLASLGWITALTALLATARAGQSSLGVVAMVAVVTAIVVLFSLAH